MPLDEAGNGGDLVVDLAEARLVDHDRLVRHRADLAKRLAEDALERVAGVGVVGRRTQFEVTHTPDPAAALELISALRQLIPSLPVMIVTAHELAARVAAACEAGCPVLLKPLLVNELLVTVTALLTR